MERVDHGGPYLVVRRPPAQPHGHGGRQLRAPAREGGQQLAAELLLAAVQRGKGHGGRGPELRGGGGAELRRRETRVLPDGEEVGR